MSVRLAFQQKFARGKIVNLGCGDIPVYLGPDVTNVDIDLYNYPNFVQADLHNLPFKDDEFDTSVLGDVLEHSPNPKKMLQEAGRVAKTLVATIFEETKDVFPEIDGPSRRGYETTADWYKTIPAYNNCIGIIDDETIPHHYHIQNFTDMDIFTLFYDAGLVIDLYHKVQEGTEKGKPYFNWLVLAHKGETK